MARFIIDTAGNIDNETAKKIAVKICDALMDIEFDTTTAICIDKTNTNQFHNSDEIEENSNKLTVKQIQSFNDYHCSNTGEQKTPLIDTGTDIDFKKQTFEIGKSYKIDDIIQMHKINHNVSTLSFLTPLSKKPRKEVVHLNLHLEDVDLWFIKDTYSTYRCVMFEN